MPAADRILQVAIKAPLFRLFDYLPPTGEGAVIRPGMRVRVPFGRGRTTGVVVATSDRSSVPPGKLRRIADLIDDEPVLDAHLMALLAWAADYYHEPPGEVYAAALPRLLRAGRARVATTTVWSLTATGRDVEMDRLERRAPRQAEALQRLRAAGDGSVDADTLAEALGAGWRRIVRRLEQHGWVRRATQDAAARAAASGGTEPAHPPSAEQRAAVEAVSSRLDRFGAFLLDGVTGSGKTEVYLQIIAAVLASSRQTLVLVPEIGLTPQLVDRFRRRLGVPIALLHSGLTDRERLSAWRMAHDGSARVVVGTRSAVFASLPAPGLIVVDEEHDASYKQQDGFRYSARDLAVMRARRHGIPVVLGSATPSLESLQNARSGRYRRLPLAARPGGATLPAMQLIDMRREAADGGLSGSLQRAMRRHLDAGGQVLLFLNRRGFAPAWFCPDCGWVAPCRRCDARMTYHRAAHSLRCHHCDARRAPETDCPECSAPLQPVGAGTERVEETLERLFPDDTTVRIDRDSTRRRGSLEELLTAISRGERRILIGTQMLTKGHHFPGVTLVGIIDADQGLFGTDPRSSERLAQLVIQVGGRAGRAERPGTVLVQTRCPDHPLLNTLIDAGYGHFAAAALAEREAAGWPPFTALALLRAEAQSAALPVEFLERARRLAGQPAGVDVLGPAPAPMARRAGRYRAQLLLQGERPALQAFLAGWTPQLADLEDARRVRWSLDVDPIELF